MYSQPTMLMRLLVPVVLIAVSILSPMTTNNAVAASGYAYYWSLTFDYANNFDGILHVKVGYDENGGVQNPPLHEQDFNVSCQRVGNVSVAGGSATFAGGYLTCTLDVKSALRATFSQCNELVKGCTMNIADVEKYRSFRMMTSITSPAVGSMPVFAHEDAKYEITSSYVSPSTTNAQIAATITPLGWVQSSPLPMSLAVVQAYESRYLCAPLGGCAMAFEIAGSLEGVPQGNEYVEFSTPSSTIYIGYNPATNATIPAGTQMSHLFIDPPNFGNGG